MDTKGIKNIIFDLGVVILNIDPEQSVKAFKEIGFDRFEDQYTLAGQTNIFDKLETGKITPTEFFEQICEVGNIKLSNQQIEHAWNALLLDFPEERIKLIESLKKDYRIFLLSNTNAIHYNKYSADFHEQFGKPFDSLFEKMYLSHEVGYRKPDRRIYESLLADSGIVAQESLFIDDLEANIKMASQLGIRGHFLKPDEDITELFYTWQELQ